jgi:cobalt transport protein ATP-binding subunit
MLTLEKVCFSYVDGGFALRDIDLEITRGDFFAIVGSNGSGKTTLLKIMIGLLNPTSGNVFLEGKNLLRKKNAEIITTMSMVFQDPNDQIFLPLVYQDVTYGPLNLGMVIEEAEEVAREALRMVGLEHKWNSHIGNLSYGEKKRVALAGALAMRPKFILLDEPTSGLDPLGTHDFMHTLAGLREEKGLTVVMATHDLDLVPLYCNRMAILREGTLAKCGETHEIFQDTDIIRSSSLRLPRIGHLMEILKKRNDMPLAWLPLTISGAREAILRWAGEKQ